MRMPLKMPRMPIDEYDMRARLFPALLVSFPIIGFIYGAIPAARSFWGGLSGSIFEAAALYVLMRIGRDRGARLQEKLRGLWGGMPTTIMLRHRDEYLDSHTKERYKKVLMKFSGLTFPTEAQELANLSEADKVYDSAVRALKERRRGKTYRLVFNENCNYGFVRNLVGLKIVGIFIIVSTLSADLLLNLRRSVEPKGVLVSAAVSLLTLLILSLMGRSSVRRSADAYALALLRTCESTRAT